MIAPREYPDGAIIIPIPAPCSLLNANHRRHFRVKARMVKAWRRAARAEAGVVSPCPTPARVTVYVHRHNRASYDAGNYYDTAKPVLDGLVDAGILPDDSNTYVVGPDMRQGEPWPGGGVTVLLEPLSPSDTIATAMRIADPTGDPLWSR